MVTSTVGILLKTIKHSDSTAIIQVYSRDFGRKAYFLRGLAKKRNNPRALLFPLSLLEMQVTEKESKSLGQVRDISLNFPISTLISNPAKSAVAMFLTEVLEKCIVENYKNEILYDFLENSIKLLDTSDQVRNFHIWFLLSLSKHFGFQPSKSKLSHSAHDLYFNLEAGSFENSKPALESFLDPNISRLLHTFLGMNFDGVSEHNISAGSRSKLLHGIIDYYKIHVPHFNHLSSLHVLETVFDF